MVRRPLRHYKAAIVKLDLLGDAVLAVSAVRVLLDHYGHDCCLLVVSERGKAFFRAEFPRTEQLVLPVELSHGELMKSGNTYRGLFREVSCENVISLRHHRVDWDDVVLSWLNGTRTFALTTRSVSPHKSRGRTFTHRIRNTQTEFVRPVAADPSFSLELERHRQLLAAVLGREVARHEVIPKISSTERHDRRPEILVTPFGSHAIRDFPAAALATTLRDVRCFSESPIFIYADDSQGEKRDRLLADLRSAGLENIFAAPAVTTGGFIDAIARAEIVVTVETSTAHIATALDRRCFVMIGGGHFGELGPWQRSSKQQWVTNPLECFNCDWACRFAEPYCLTGVNLAAIAGALEEIRFTDDSTSS